MRTETCLMEWVAVDTAADEPLLTNLDAVIQLRVSSKACESCLSQSQAKAAVDGVFMPVNELSSVKVAVKRLQQGALSAGRSASKSMSIMGK
ncbi:hypothetical protein WJX74_000896 [Apatococcus lobatus]|uniref:Uncharacterized protein n=1 Tax=Apatococcus lobatus TaxID=904363 RepID=A0AAW1QVA8_9CHLO